MGVGPRFVFFLCFFSILSSLWNEASVEASQRVPPLPDRMAVLGDSMSEGMLADHALEDGISNGELFRLLGLVSIRDPKRRMEAARERYANTGKVWSSGDDSDSIVFSHLKRIRFLGRPLDANNYSVSGAHIHELEEQVDQLLYDQEAAGVPFDYITLLIGGNDLNVDSIDQLPNPQDMVAGVETHLRRLLDANPSLALLWMGLPDIIRALTETKDIHVTRIFGQSYNCAEVREMVYGNTVLFQTDDPEVLSRLRQVLGEYEWEAQRLIERLSEDYPSAYLKTIQGYEVFGDDYARYLAFDCFHASEDGQAELAEVSWMNGFWGEAYGRLLNLAASD